VQLGAVISSIAFAVSVVVAACNNLNQRRPTAATDSDGVGVVLGEGVDVGLGRTWGWPGSEEQPDAGATRQARPATNRSHDRTGRR